MIASSSSFRNDDGAASRLASSTTPIFHKMPALSSAFGGRRPLVSISYPTVSQTASRSSFVNSGDHSRSNRPTATLIVFRSSSTDCAIPATTHTCTVCVPVRNSCPDRSFGTRENMQHYAICGSGGSGQGTQITEQLSILSIAVKNSDK